MTIFRTSIGLTTLLLAACGPQPVAFDAGVLPALPGDAGDAARPDAGQSPEDAGQPPEDAGQSDAGQSDAGIEAPDAGMTPDAGAGVQDAGFLLLDLDGGVSVHVPSGVLVDLLPTTQTGSNGLTAEYSVDIPAGTDALMIAAIAGHSNTALQVQSLANPNGELLADGTDHFLHKSRSVQALGAHATLVPESPDYLSLFVPGTYTFRVQASYSSHPLLAPMPQPDHPVQVLLFRRPTPQPAARHVLDINLYFTGAAGVDAAQARTNGRVQQALSELAGLYAQASIALGEIRYLDTPAGYDEVVGMVPNPSAPTKSLAELLRLSAGGPPGLNFFFVEVLDPIGFGPIFGILGVSGGIPGPTLLTGTDRSGVIVLLDAATWVPRMRGGETIEDDFLGTVMAHEGGHFLGLSHTYEQQQSWADNLSDTPLQSAPNADDYLMQPSAFMNGGTLSPFQGQTLRRNPLVRAVP